MESIHPYELMGVTFSTPLREVRKRYYQLALICHPDKGGSPRDMLVLQAAYKWIEHQLSSVESRDLQDYDKAQEAFDAFVASLNGKEVMPSMMQVALEACGYSVEDIDEWFLMHADADAVKKRPEEGREWFRQMVLRDIYLASLQDHDVTFEDVCMAAMRSMTDSWNTLVPASVPGGYGEYMKEVAENVATNFGKREVILYKEQDPLPIKQLGTDYHIPVALDNYSTISSGGKLAGYDYKDAFVDGYVNDAATLESAFGSDARAYNSNVSLGDQLKELQMERKIMEMLVAETTEKVHLGFVATL